MIDDKKVVMIMKKIAKELEEFKEEIDRGSLLPEVQKGEEVDYTSVLRELTYIEGISNIVEQVSTVIEIADAPNSEIEKEFAEVGLTPKELVIDILISKLKENEDGEASRNIKKL